MTKHILIVIFFLLHVEVPAHAQPPGHWVPSFRIAYPRAQVNAFGFIDSTHALVLIDSGTTSTHFYFTSNGGASWIPWGSTDSGYYMFSGAAHPVQILSGKNIYYAGAASDFWRSNDSGHTFRLSSGPWSPTNQIASKMFTSEFGSVIVGYPDLFLGVYETRDSGQSFELRGSTSAITGSVNDAFFLDSLNWLVALHYKNILKTRDGGLTWDTVLNPKQVAFYNAVIPSPDRSHLYVTGGLASGKSYSASFFASTDTGNTWRADSSIYGNRVARMACPAPGKLWALVRTGLQTAADSLFYSSDDGKSWAIDSVTFIGKSLADIVWPDSTHGYITAQQGDTAIIYRYVNVSGMVPEEAPQNRTHELGLSCYPSPVSQLLHVDLSRARGVTDFPLSAGLFDVLGRKVLDLTDLVSIWRLGTSRGFEINVSDLPAGVYTLHCSSGIDSYDRAISVIH